MKRSWITIFFFLAALTLRGEVYSLRPGGAAGGRGSVLSALPGCSGAPLCEEPVVVNGAKLTLQVFRSTAAFDELAQELGVPGAAGTLRCTRKLGSGATEERLLLIDGGLGKPVTVFRIEAPVRGEGAPAWPQELPQLPEGAHPVLVVRFPERGGVFGSFENSANTREAALRSVDGELLLLGWKPVGGEADPRRSGSGDMYVRTDPPQLMLVNFGAHGEGFFFRR